MKNACFHILFWCACGGEPIDIFVPLIDLTEIMEIERQCPFCKKILIKKVNIRNLIEKQRFLDKTLNSVSQKPALSKKPN